MIFGDGIADMVTRNWDSNNITLWLSSRNSPDEEDGLAQINCVEHRRGRRSAPWEPLRGFVIRRLTDSSPSRSRAGIGKI